MPDLPAAFVAHASPGRTRLRIPSKKTDHAYWAALEKNLGRCEGVKEVVVTPRTASVLVLYSGRFYDLLRQEEVQKLFVLSWQQEEPLPKKTVSARSLAGVAGKQVGWQAVAVVSLVGVSLFQVLRGKLTIPAWHAALWYAYNIGRSAGDQNE